MSEVELGESPIAADEVLARFLLHRRYVRQDGTVRDAAFVPYPWPDLSVTRHSGLVEDELWSKGRSVASETGKVLYGRADVVAETFLDLELTVESDPIEGNPNHANVGGWPAEKPAQKMKAKLIAAKATVVRVDSPS